MAGGDLDARASEEGSTEQREVAAAFNDMTGRLASSLRGQREFVANASHQLRTPLTGLRLRLESASLKTRDPEVERELHAAERETERLARLLTELLRLAGEGERRPAQPIDVADAVRAAHERWESPAEQSGHELRVEPGARRDRARVRRGRGRDPRQPDRERAQLLARGHDRDARAGRATATTCRIEVLDEGSGIDPDEAERVFQRFYRGSASHGGAAGSGLGLSVVEQLAERWGGGVSLTNRPEGGARAEVSLPAAVAERVEVS